MYVSFSVGGPLDAGRGCVPTVGGATRGLWVCVLPVLPQPVLPRRGKWTEADGKNAIRWCKSTWVLGQHDQAVKFVWKSQIYGYSHISQRLSLRTSGIIWPNKKWSTLVHVVDWYLFCANPLPKPTVGIRWSGDKVCPGDYSTQKIKRPQT